MCSEDLAVSRDRSRVRDHERGARGMVSSRPDHQFRATRWCNCLFVRRLLPPKRWLVFVSLGVSRRLCNAALDCPTIPRGTSWCCATGAVPPACVAQSSIGLARLPSNGLILPGPTGHHFEYALSRLAPSALRGMRRGGDLSMVLACPCVLATRDLSIVMPYWCSLSGYLRRMLCRCVELLCPRSHQP